MKHTIAYALLLGLMPALTASGAQAQSVPRIKAKIISFDGKRLTLAANKENLIVDVLPATRYLSQTLVALSDIQPGAYVGATIAKLSEGKWQGWEVHVFPESLKGTDEGLFPLPSDASKSIVDGVVAASQAGWLTLRFRGLGPKDGPACIGHAPANPLEGCQGMIQVAVGPQVRFLALKAADKTVLVPGAVVAISIMAGPDGRPVTPGLTVENDSAAIVAPPAK